MDMEDFYIKMGIFMKAILMKVDWKDMVFIEKIMEVSFKENGNVINNMEEVVKYGQMEQNMKVIMY